MHEYDRSTRNCTGLKASDVCLSYRFARKEATIEDLMRMWKPTRIEWSYVTTPETIQTVKKAGLVFVGSLNTIAWAGPDQDGVLFDGSRMVAPWMQHFYSGKGVGWACVNKAPTLPRRIEHLKKLQTQGVNTIQHDDWMFNLHGVFWGGCFCKNCVTGFARYLDENATPEDMEAVGVQTWKEFDYLDYLRARLGRTSTKDYLDRRGQDPLCSHFRMFQLMSTRTYFEKLMLAGGDIRLTVNSNMTPPRIAQSFLLDMTDYLVGETDVRSEADLWEIVSMLKMADALNLPQVLSPFPRGTPDVQLVRTAIALTYAMGHRMLVPWDVYIGKEPERWFGKVEEYGDLYDFVRENASLLDGYEAWGNVVVTAPISSNHAAMAAAGESVRILMRAGYPCGIAAYGVAGDIVHVPVSPSDFSRAGAVVKTIPSVTSSEDAAAFASAISEACVVEFDRSQVSSRTMVRQVSELLPPAYRVYDPKLLVLPRWAPNDPNAPRVVHLVNLGTSRQVSVWLSDEVCGSAGASPSFEALLLQPGEPARNVTAVRSAGGLRLRDLDIDVWGMLVIRRN